VKVSELGEFGLIELLSRILGETKPSGSQLILGIGDDAAAWNENHYITLATTDTMVQGVHFTLENATWRELGWKILAINLSDIAAMGGLPLYGLVSLALPAETEVRSVTQLYEGMVEIARQFSLEIVGGNISEAPSVVLTASVVGRGNAPLLTRSAAIPGEMIAVTGYLGSAAAGLDVLTHQLQLNDKSVSFLREVYLRPRPRLAEGQTLLKWGVRSAIDISDGLFQDLGHLCKMSGVGATVRIDDLPIHPIVRDGFRDSCLDLALSGGEDYELLFTANDESIADIRSEMECPVTVVGEITGDKSGHITLLDKKGKAVVQGHNKGWEHFSKARSDTKAR
jgi:thiamine-monophosphate kinase